MSFIDSDKALKNFVFFLINLLSMYIYFERNTLAIT